MSMSDSQRWFILAGVASVGGLIYLLAPVLTPFAIAGLLAYFGDPLVDRLQRVHPSRTLAVICVFVIFGLLGLSLLLFLVPLLQQQILSFLRLLPACLEWVQGHLLPGISATLGLEGELPGLDALRQALAQNWQKAGNFALNLVAGISQSGMMLLAWMANLVLIPVVSFYLLRDWDVLMQHLRGLLPRQIEPRVVTVVAEVDQVLAEFLRGQLLVMMALAVIYSTGLALLGLELALLIGITAGLVSFVPYLGLVVGFSFAAIAAFIQFHAVEPVLLAGLVFVVGQLAEGMFLTPRLVGERIGLHPVAVIFAVLAGGQLFGFIGILLALPVAAVIMVLLVHLHSAYRESGYYQP